MSNVVVTGSSTGIGQATVLSLAQGGHTVFATMRNLDARGPLLELAGEYASRIHIEALDVDSNESVESCFQHHTREESGRCLGEQRRCRRRRFRRRDVH